MSRRFRQHGKTPAAVRFPTMTAQIAFKLALGMFDGPVVGGGIRRAVDGYHQGFGQHTLNGDVIEIAAVHFN